METPKQSKPRTNLENLASQVTCGIAALWGILLMSVLGFIVLLMILGRLS